MIDTVEHNKKVYATIIYADTEIKGLNFYTPEHYPLQLSIQKRFDKVKPHFHKKVKRETVGTQEVIYIVKGKMRIDFFDDNRIKIDERILKTGDVILLNEGAHGIVMLEETKFIEVKNGPYVSAEEDKLKFDYYEKNSGF